MAAPYFMQNVQPQWNGGNALIPGGSSPFQPPMPPMLGPGMHLPYQPPGAPQIPYGAQHQPYQPTGIPQIPYGAPHQPFQPSMPPQIPYGAPGGSMGGAGRTPPWMAGGSPAGARSRPFPQY